MGYMAGQRWLLPAGSHRTVLSWAPQGPVLPRWAQHPDLWHTHARCASRGPQSPCSHMSARRESASAASLRVDPQSPVCTASHFDLTSESWTAVAQDWSSSIAPLLRLQASVQQQVNLTPSHRRQPGRPAPRQTGRQRSCPRQAARARLAHASRLSRPHPGPVRLRLLRPRQAQSQAYQHQPAAAGPATAARPLRAPRTPPCACCPSAPPQPSLRPCLVHAGTEQARQTAATSGTGMRTLGQAATSSPQVCAVLATLRCTCCCDCCRASQVLGRTSFAGDGPRPMGSLPLPRRPCLAEDPAHPGRCVAGRRAQLGHCRRVQPLRTPTAFEGARNRPGTAAPACPSSCKALQGCRGVCVPAAGHALAPRLRACCACAGTRLPAAPGALLAAAGCPAAACASGAWQPELAPHSGAARQAAQSTCSARAAVRATRLCHFKALARHLQSACSQGKELRGRVGQRACAGQQPGAHPFLRLAAHREGCRVAPYTSAFSCKKCCTMGCRSLPGRLASSCARLRAWLRGRYTGLRAHVPATCSAPAQGAGRGQPARHQPGCRLQAGAAALWQSWHSFGHTCCCSRLQRPGSQGAAASCGRGQRLRRPQGVDHVHSR